MYLFVSYTRTDRLRAGHLSQDLRMAGHEVWLDTELSAAGTWWDTILNQIGGSDAVIAVVSRSSLRSRACHAELEFAARLGRPILAVTVEALSSSVLPPEL